MADHGHTVAKRLRSAFGLAIFAAVVAVLAWHWPVTLGGSTQLIWISGDSMLPTFEHRDLLIVRSAQQYAVGDVVLYPIPAGEAGEGILIVHRIVDQLTDGDGVVRYITRGDNRDSADPWQPTADEIVGSGRSAVPFGPVPTRWIQTMLSPLPLALTLGALSGALTWSFVGPEPSVTRRAGVPAWPAPQPRSGTSPRVCAGLPTRATSPWTPPDGRDRRCHGS
jgi:signal peptidase I